MISFVNTLVKLANAANSEAVKLDAKKEAASKEQAKALFAKQGKFITLVKLAQDLEKELAAFKDPAENNLNDVFAALVPAMNEMLEDIKDLAISDKKMIAALNSPETYHFVDAATHVLRSLKKNLSLRQQALEEAAKSTTLTEAARCEFMVDYKKHCQQDSENLFKALDDEDPLAFGHSLEEANRRWTELLKRVFHIETPEPAKMTAPSSPFADVFKKGISAVSKLAKDMMSAKSKKEKKGVFMGFLGALFSIAIGLFANLFKSFFGNTPEERDVNVKDFTDNVSHLMVDLFKGEDDDAKHKAKHKAKPKATALMDDEADLEDDLDLDDELDVEGAPILPMMTHRAASARTTEDACPELSAKAFAKAFSSSPSL